ncbi:MAG: protein BatD [Myxococcaceae bacterium]|nr:protein BatD [Myxococcaceae bacterium]
MRRIGSPLGAPRGAISFAFAAVLAATAAFAEEPDFYQTVDRAEVGTEDTFRLNVVIVNAPEDATLTPPDLSDFEVLSKTPVDSTSIQIGSGGSQIQRVRKWVFVLRPRRAGQLTIGASRLDLGGRTLRADAITITAKKGRLQDPALAQRQRRPDPFQGFFGGNPFQGMPGFDDEDDAFPFGGPPDVDIPTTEADLFVRTYVDKKEAWVGQQVTLSVYVFSRVDLSSVDSVKLPKLEGFWSEDIDTPQTLSGETRILNGVPYKAYLLKRKAIFPLKAGTQTIDAAEADITTGYLFAGRRVHRVGNKVKLEVRPLPDGAPRGFATTNVGRWRLSVDATPEEVELGNPVTVRVTLEGVGNVKNVTPPKLTAPPSLRIFDPTLADKPTTRNGQFGGRRVQEYLVMPQQTGTFTIPSLEFPYFDPESRSYEIARTEPIQIRVTPGAAGAVATGAHAATGPVPADAPKNVLASDGVMPIRHSADFSQRGAAVWSRPWFVPAVVSPLGVWLALVGVGLVRARAAREDEGSIRKKKARAARRRLAAAETLRANGATADFYAEVEKAVITFLDARLGEPVAGLTREALAQKLTEKGIPADRQRSLLAVLETCELGRFAPGGADPAARDRVLDDAEAAMEALDAR